MKMSKDSKKGIGKFLAGALVGAGLGILFAPKKGSETRKDLKNKIDELIGNIREIDIQEVKDEFFDKVDEIKRELEDLDKEKGTPVLENAANEVREKAIVVVKEVLEKLENSK